LAAVLDLLGALGGSGRGCRRHDWTSGTRALLPVILNRASAGSTGSVFAYHAKADRAIPGYGGAEWPGDAGGLPGDTDEWCDGKSATTRISAATMTIAVIAPTARPGL